MMFLRKINENYSYMLIPQRGEVEDIRKGYAPTGQTGNRRGQVDSLGNQINQKENLMRQLTEGWYCTFAEERAKCGIHLRTVISINRNLQQVPAES
jgi:hypothetical protein